MKIRRDLVAARDATTRQDIRPNASPRNAHDAAPVLRAVARESAESPYEIET